MQTERPDPFKNFTISDLHAGPIKRRPFFNTKERARKRLELLEPDICRGDMSRREVNLET